VLMRGELTAANARRIQISDLVYGLAAGVVLAVGLLRVFYFEKGAAYYFHSVPFLIKFGLFVVIGLLSIYPTLEFLSWSKSLKQAVPPAIGDAKRRRLRLIIHIELAAIVVLLLGAALMARGIGRF